MFQYICVLDFEATCDSDKKFSPRNEIIEFPSVLLRYNEETKNHIKVAEFQRFCKPLYNIKLTEYCTNLTGITQKQVDEGMDFEMALNEHHSWLGENTNLYENPNDVIIVTCGWWDLQTMLPQECVRWQIHPESIYKKVINVKLGFEATYNKPKLGMAKMLEACSIKLEGKHHSGIDDCRNIAKLVQHFTKKGYNWTMDKMTKIEKERYNINKKSKSYERNKEILENRRGGDKDRK